MFEQPALDELHRANQHGLLIRQTQDNLMTTQRHGSR
jgi:hypothetical protein